MCYVCIVLLPLRVINTLLYLLHSVLIYKVECLFVCLLPINSAYLLSTPHMMHILNQHDPVSVLVHNSFALTVC